MLLRGKNSNGKIYYFRLKDPASGKYLSARSTHSASRKEAERIAKHEAALRDILDTDQFITSSMSLISFVELFYNDERSPWLQEKREHNEHALQSDHFRASRSYFLRYVKKEINKTLTIGDVKTLWLKDLQRKIREHNPTLKPQTVNAIFSTLTSPLRYAKRNGIIERDPTEGIIPYASKRVVTGSLTEAEFTSLYRLDWPNKVGKLAFLLSIFTGMRIGEVLALRFCDLEIRDNEGKKIYLVHISHSWSKTHGLKSPKNGKERLVPIPSCVWDLLQDVRDNVKEDDGFIFKRSLSEKPLSDKILRNALKDALERIGVSIQNQEERNLRFHSTRHYFNSALAPLVQNESLRKVIGHSSPSMTEHYHHITDFELGKVAEAQEEAFRCVMPSRLEATA